jgi:molybdenum cofactor cytidylyltransferase
MNRFRRISAVILAAGESKRMGRPKMLLPWGKTTILGQVVATFAEAGVEDICVVTGGARMETEALVQALSQDFPVRSVYNDLYAQGEMLSSIQVGLSSLTLGIDAALIGLGDQPQVEVDTVVRLCSLFDKSGAPLVIPSFENRRGHPWLAAKPLWRGLQTLPRGSTPRQFLEAHQLDIIYLPIEDDSILRDIDTPEEYLRERP